MSKRVLLIFPHFLKGRRVQPKVEIPLGLLCVATPVSLADYTVKIIDQRIESDWHSLLIKELSLNPLCVGLSTMTGQQLHFALEISRLVKKYSETPVVWGGIHPSLLPDQTLHNENIDVVVQGEGEETFLELVEAFEGTRPLPSVKGIWFKEEGIVKQTECRPFLDLNQQAPLVYDLFDLSKYNRVLFDVQHQPFFTSRGCPRQCTFCFNTALNQKKWRAMDPDLVVERVKDFVEKYNVQGLRFNDSNFFIDLERGRRILKGIIEANLGIVISKLNTDANTLFMLTKDDLALLTQAGCRRLSVAVESASKKIQALFKKPVAVDQVLKFNRSLKQSAIVPNYVFMMGVPTETKDDLMESISLAFRLIDENPEAGISWNIYTPYPGTELFNITVKHGLTIPQGVEEWIPFHYRNLTQNGPWLSKEMRKITRMLDFCSFFIGQKSLIRPIEKTNRLAMLLGKLYSPVARKRVKNLWYQFPLEINLARIFRLYG
ncbi:B12-binding domain-containing radical SAM protein [candidate division CSSED10-310 bacterium]|uniref:B12-binding domain-containing radical SAM protein n=1 Tax=candidate division CSSED10-310 bacterium TaxID=2855610 RepID=A0ABV6YYM1_UNCC1